jgi:hypothetical protein
MPNFSKATVTRVGRLLGNSGKPIATLSEWSAVPPKSIRNWMLSSEDPQYRKMPSVAKRMLTLLAYFSMTGQLTKQLLADIKVLEKAMEDEKAFQVTARRVSRVIAKANEEPVEAAPAQDATA